ncbi:MAG: glutathione S-transferase family protein [Gaiella sp.]
MRLYHQPRSRSTRVLWLLEELGAPFELTVIARDDKQSNEYRRLHPLGRAPVLELDEGPVFESAALILHLADVHSEAGLIASPGSYERALQYHLVLFGMTELDSSGMEVARRLWKDEGEPHDDVVEAARRRFANTAGVVGTALCTIDYRAADRFSVADVVIRSVLSFARVAELAELPAGIVPYVDRLEQRPARQRAVAVSVPA